MVFIQFEPGCGKVFQYFQRILIQFFATNKALDGLCHAAQVSGLVAATVEPFVVDTVAGPVEQRILFNAQCLANLIG